MGKFQKPFVYNRSLLNPKAGDPDGFVSNDGMWAAIPWAGNIYDVQKESQTCQRIEIKNK